MAMVYGRERARSAQRAAARHASAGNQPGVYACCATCVHVVYAYLSGHPAHEANPPLLGLGATFRM